MQCHEYRNLTGKTAGRDCFRPAATTLTSFSSGFRVGLDPCFLRGGFSLANEEAGDWAQLGVSDHTERKRLGPPEL